MSRHTTSPTGNLQRADRVVPRSGSSLVGLVSLQPNLLLALHHMSINMVSCIGSDDLVVAAATCRVRSVVASSPPSATWWAVNLLHEALPPKNRPCPSPMPPLSYWLWPLACSTVGLDCWWSGRTRCTPSAFFCHLRPDWMQSGPVTPPC